MRVRYTRLATQVKITQAQSSKHKPPFNAVWLARLGAADGLIYLGSRRFWTLASDLGSTDKTGPCPGGRETGSLQAILDLLPLLLFSDSDALCTSLFQERLLRTHELESHSNTNMNPHPNCNIICTSIPSYRPGRSIIFGRSTQESSSVNYPLRSARYRIRSPILLSCPRCSPLPTLHSSSPASLQVQVTCFAMLSPLSTVSSWSVGV